jgi:hypothetical protein
VFLVGDFCDWHMDHLPMRRLSEHEWMLMLRLPPGSYEFRYYADGRWYTDYAAFGVNVNAFKEFNSVLRVPKVRPIGPQAARPVRTLSSRLAASA